MTDHNATSEALEADLSSFYDQQAPDRATWALSPARTTARTNFVARLRSERRTTVIDVGAGTGQDVEAFVESGLDATAVDLSPRNVELCADKGAKSLLGSVLNLPFDDDTFQAGWTMSALLHVPDDHLAQALGEIGRCLGPGAPLAIGLWGGRDKEYVLETDHHEPHRFFAYRSNNSLQAALAEHGEVSNWTTWPGPTDDSHYQFCHLHFGTK